MRFKILFIVMVTILALCGCSKEKVDSEIQSSIDINSEVSTVPVTQNESSNTESKGSSVEEKRDSPKKGEPIINNQEENKQVSSSAENVSKTENKTSKNEKPVTTPDIPSSKVEIEKPPESNEKDTQKEPEKENSQEEKEEEITEDKKDETSYQEPSIETSEYSVQAANSIADLLNAERSKLGVNNRTLLTGLNKIAVFRSKQIIEQFSHNWVDANGKSWQAADYAAAQFKYGKHTVINETRFDVTTGTVVETGNIIETYSYGGTENIAKGGIYSNNAEELADYIVSVFKSSSNHWNSLMRKNTLYDGIGVTISGNYWYCSINSSETNYG